jgi:hypothetical protein
MRSVILIKWSEISKVIAQGSSAQSHESINCPQMMEIEETTMFEGRQTQVVLFVYH